VKLLLGGEESYKAVLKFLSYFPMVLKNINLEIRSMEHLKCPKDNNSQGLKKST
jgi:hypothetical protein